MSSHRRYNPLLDEWVLVAPHRTQRPWNGQQEPAPAAPAVAYDPNCYLCPGNPRAAGRANPNYTGAFVFDNDYPALLPDSAVPETDGLLRSQPEAGICRVVCFSPRHDLSLARLPLAEIEAITTVWTDQYRELSVRPGTASVMIFENRGAMMGTSNPHPHGQIWANQHLPNVLVREQRAFERQSCILCEYLALELTKRERIVAEHEHWVALVPYWAYWPFELLLLPRRHVFDFTALTEAERLSLAAILQKIHAGYDRVFNVPFPNAWGFHQLAAPAWHLHAHFFPPLLRSATVKKFMVGYELLGMPQRDLTPEAAAARLREVL